MKLYSKKEDSIYLNLQNNKTGEEKKREKKKKEEKQQQLRSPPYMTRLSLATLLVLTDHVTSITPTGEQEALTA
jgi:hypothetical protein